MAQQGSIWKKAPSWFLRYRENVNNVPTLRCVYLAPICDRYRTKSDLAELVAEKMASVRQAAKCPQSGRMFTAFIEETYLPYVKRTKKASTYAGRKTYYEHYIKPRVAGYSLRDFSVKTVYDLLSDVTKVHKVNVGTVAKIKSLLYGMFAYAMSIGEFPAKEGNPVKDVILPEGASQIEPTEAATREEVQALLVALKGMPLVRAAVGIMALCGVRPGEARGMRWEDWDRAEKQIHVCRSIWHREVSTPKTEKSIRYVTVTDELREILLDLWNEKGCPISGYILAAEKDWPVILDNLTKRVIRPTAEKAGITWKRCYALRSFHGTEVRMKSNSKTAADALGNSEKIFDKHYNKPTEVFPDVRRAVNDAFSGLVQ